MSFETGHVLEWSQVALGLGLALALALALSGLALALALALALTLTFSFSGRVRWAAQRGPEQDRACLHVGERRRRTARPRREDGDAAAS